MIFEGYPVNGAVDVQPHRFLEAVNTTIQMCPGIFPISAGRLRLGTISNPAKVAVIVPLSREGSDIGLA